MKCSHLLPFVVTALLGACSQDSGDRDAGQPTAPAAELAKFTLTADPGEALGVVAAKHQGEAEQVVVEGRVHDITKGFAMLKLMDTGLDYCGQVNKEDNCPTPWDYCCDSKDDRLANSLLVELRGADGRPIATASLPELRLCDLIKVRGALQKDAQGNPVLVASGVFRVERPQLPDYVEWPQ
ncbi:MAG: hypothetical protein H6835_00250 [Planctomycetes bacterium]|nr:hypothetical protein [Planctomycetota bacterium]